MQQKPALVFFDEMLLTTHFNPQTLQLIQQLHNSAKKTEKNSGKFHLHDCHKNKFWSIETGFNANKTIPSKSATTHKTPLALQKCFVEVHSIEEILLKIDLSPK